MGLNIQFRLKLLLVSDTTKLYYDTRAYRRRDPPSTYLILKYLKTSLSDKRAFDPHLKTLTVCKRDGKQKPTAQLGGKKRLPPFFLLDNFSVNDARGATSAWENGPARNARLLLAPSPPPPCNVDPTDFHMMY